MDTPNMALRTSQLISSSLHFWWVAFLRCSKDYWWICQQKGNCLDSRLVKVWQDFGDVFQYNSLMQWWKDRGVILPFCKGRRSRNVTQPWPTAAWV